MSRILYLATAWFSLLFLPRLISAHLIDVVAGKKECFFEDLHQHDKVQRSPLQRSIRALCIPR